MEKSHHWRQKVLTMLCSSPVLSALIPFCHSTLIPMVKNCAQITIFYIIILFLHFPHKIVHEIWMAGAYILRTESSKQVNEKASSVFKFLSILRLLSPSQQGHKWEHRSAAFFYKFCKLFDFWNSLFNIS